MQFAPPDFDRTFGALADATRRDIVRRAIDAEEGVAELASHYPMSFAAVQKHVAVLERAGLLTKRRQGREALASGDVEAVRSVGAMLTELEALWRGRISRMDELLAEPQTPTTTDEKD
jgi:DNA-binding transcriptional ArsR family regulator